MNDNTSIYKFNTYYFNGVPLMAGMSPALGKGELRLVSSNRNGGYHFRSWEVDFSEMTQDEITAMLVTHRMEDGADA